ncbi:MAG: glycosyltransferase [Oscillospiraceae bacterium]|jgi:glycosyltransferase involved in cell wall biosynthesis|nr:glycosyltransferase [Oscillospiraceae bacterium]
MDLISVIVPVYNTEKYLTRCLDSIINQTYTSLEILLVNDGSTDSCGEICNEYAKKDSRIIVFHKENGGDASARNVGLANKTGNYVGFIDGDDWAEPTMYETLLNNLKKNHEASVCVTNFYRNTSTLQFPMENQIEIPEFLILPKDMMIYALDRDNYMGFGSYLWNKLFAVNKIKGLIFDESLSYGSDVLFFAECVISLNNKGVYLDKHLYHYYKRSGSLATDTTLRNRMSIMTVYRKISDMLKTYNLDNILFWANAFYCHHASMAAEKAIEENNCKALEYMKSEIINHLPDYEKTNHTFPEKMERMNRIVNMS